MTQEEILKNLIRVTEERYISYKKMLEDIFKDRNSFPATDEFVIWFKEYLREQKNYEEGKLKELRLEMEHYRSRMNPPYMYNYKKKS